MIVTLGMGTSVLGIGGSGWVASAKTDLPVSDQQVAELQSIVNNNRDVFGGLWGDPDSHVVTINVVPGSSTTSSGTRALAAMAVVGTPADQRVRTGPKQWKIRFSESMGPSLATLDVVLSKVTTAEPWASRVKQDLVSWYVDPKLRSIVIGVAQITPSLLLDAQNTFGSLARLTVVDRPVLQDRWLDSQPYYGSDHITLASGGPCTSSFEAYDPNASNHHGVLTAGHCYQTLGTVVAQGYVSGGILHASGNLGKITRQSYTDNQADAAFMDSTTIGTSVSDFIWRGPNPPTGITKPSGAGTSFVGLTVCFDGSWTGENCHGVVNATEVCLNIGHNDCHLEHVGSNNGSRLAQSGDSGGPVFADDGFGGLTAYGTITAGNNAGTDEYYTDITAALNRLGVGLIVN